MKKKFFSVISTVLVLAVLLSTFAGMTVSATTLSKPELTAIRSTASSVSIDWYDQNAEVSGFYVYRSETGKAGTWKKIATTDAMYYTDKTVVPTKTYYYTVKAILKENGKTIASASAPKWNITVTIDKPVFTLVGNGGKGVVLEWDARPDVTGFAIYRSRTGKAGSWTKYKMVKSNKKGSFTDTKVDIGETYYYCFKVYKTVDGKNYYSASSKAYKKVISDVAVPENLEVRATSEGMQINYSKVPGTRGYMIYKSLSGKKGTWTKIHTTTSVNKLSYLDTDVIKGVDYYYTVRSYKTVNGKSYYSDTPAGFCETCKKGVLSINLSVNEIVFSELLEKQTIRIYVDGAPMYDALKFEIADPTVVAGSWGKWNGDTIDLTLTRVGPGETTLRVYYDKYPDADVTIDVTAMKLDLDDDYILAKDYMTQAYEIFSDALKLLKESQKDDITEIKKAELINDAVAKIKEAAELLEKAGELAEKYAEFSTDDELVNNLLKVANLILPLINADSLNSSTVQLVMSYLQKVLESAGFKG